MALDTKPAWVEELKQALDQPYSPDELERLREWRARIETLNKGRTWPRGTFERLLNLARAEDAARGS